MKKMQLLLFAVLLSSALFAQSYVGPETCLSCHSGTVASDKTSWRNTLHANGYSAVLTDANSMVVEKGIVADYDQNGVDDFKDGLNFNNISSVFDPYKPNAPILGYDATNGYTITIGDVTSRVYLTYGGSGMWKQRYALRINTSEGESKDLYISPIQYNEKTHEYVLYHADAWYDGSGQPIFTSASTLADAASNSRSLAKGCSGCHTTGLNLDQTTDGEWVAHAANVSNESAYADNPSYFDLDQDGKLDQINTGCERCHGPGGDHVAGGGDKTKIINPANLTSEQANNMCGMCHSRGHSKPNGTFSFAYDDTAMTSWTTGDLVDDYYSDGGGYWGDGTSSVKHHQQFRDFYRSSKPTFEFHQLTCYECHDPHGSANEHMVVEEVEEEGADGNPIVIPTEPDNNTLCLACHSTHGDFEKITKEMVADYANNLTAIGEVVSEHSNHPYDPTGTGASRCTKCHMPKMAKSAIAYDIHSHTFEAVSPQKTLDFNMPSSCAVSCHRGFENGSTPFFNTGYDSSLTTWNETTDINLANKLKFWYDNMWFEHLGGTAATVDAAEVTTAPTVDGDTSDAAWSGSWTEIPLANSKKVFMKAAYTTTDLYILARWEDPTLSMTRGGWMYDGSAWSTVSGQSEDRIGFLWNISVPDDEFAARGCMTKCHTDAENNNNGEFEDDAYLPAGQKADMWHMKAARSLGVTSGSQSGTLTVDPNTHEVTAGSVTMSGYIDDKYIGPFDPANDPDGGRYGDAGSSTYGRNRNSAKTGPLYIEKNPADYIDAMILTQAEIDAGEVDTVETAGATALADDFAKYAALNAVVPERILRDPVGSRGDVMQAATWSDGYWVTEIKRALSNGNDDDAQFAVNNSYPFGVALMDNGGGDKHWTTGGLVATLNLGATGVADRKDNNIPNNYELSQNYPNPFNPTTTINFSVPVDGNVKIAVFNTLGEQVEVLTDNFMTAGSYNIKWNASRFASGVYFYRMEAGDFVQIKKLLLMK